METEQGIRRKGEKEGKREREREREREKQRNKKEKKRKSRESKSGLKRRQAKIIQAGRHGTRTEKALEHSVSRSTLISNKDRREEAGSRDYR